MTLAGVRPQASAPLTGVGLQVPVKPVQVELQEPVQVGPEATAILV